MKASISKTFRVGFKGLLFAVAIALVLGILSIPLAYLIGFDLANFDVTDTAQLASMGAYAIIAILVYAFALGFAIIRIKSFKRWIFK